MRTVTTVELNNNKTIDQLGFGTYLIPPETANKTVQEAIEVGYRSIDTATLYNNEAKVGQAVNDSIANSDSLTREDLFVTTKVPNNMQGYDNTLKAFEKSLSELGLDYVDMYLIHWPMPARGLYKDTWKAFEKLLSDELVTTLGVCNFTKENLLDLMENSTVAPAVNQIELHPLLQQEKLREFHKKHNIATQAWSPLARGRLLENPTLSEIAQNKQKTVSQIILRWHMQIGTIALPKVSSIARMKENIDIFDFSLDSSEMEAIAGLDNNERFGPDPETYNQV